MGSEVQGFRLYWPRAQIRWFGAATFGGRGRGGGGCLQVWDLSQTLEWGFRVSSFYTPNPKWSLDFHFDPKP